MPYVGLLMKKRRKQSGPSARDLPIYLDVEKRLLPNTEYAKPENSWSPAEKCAERVWRGYELLRDVSSGMSGLTSSTPEPQLRRRLKLIATQLYSLVVELEKLRNHIDSCPE